MSPERSDALLTDASVHLGRYVAAATMYRNEGLIDDLFTWTLGTSDLQRTVQRMDETAVERAVEGGVDAGLAAFFLRLKAVLTRTRSVRETVQEVRTEDNRPHLLAAAEAALEREGRIAEIIADDEVRPYFRLRDAFQALRPGHGS